MIVKQYNLLCLTLLLCISSVAQQGLQKKADSLFHKFAYVDATKAYKTLIKKGYNTDYATRQLADSYMFMRNPDSAVVYYKKAVAQENVPTAYYYKYAQALRGIKDYETSRIWLKRFKDEGGTLENNNLIKDTNFTTAVFNTETVYALEELNINSDLSDFGAFEYDGKLYFASSADKGVLKKSIYAWNDQPFLDVYVVEKSADTIIHHKSKLPGEVNSRFHDGPVIITKDGKTMYFSRNNYNKFNVEKDKNGISNLSIFKASLIDGKWTNLQPLPFNNSSYSVGHPALNKDETKLYFASDMPNGMGGSDIYYVAINPDGSYGTPINAGNIINTKGNELFPFINSENVLFFSSDGHLGLGLLDIFATLYNEEKTVEGVVNLGIPVNSNKDDFSFFMNNDGTTGYISSNRDGGKGDDDIYGFNRIPQLELIGTVKDSVTGTPVAGALVKLFNTSGIEIVHVETDSEGNYEINIDRNADFMVSAEKEAYLKNERLVSSKQLTLNEKQLRADLIISPLPVTDTEPKIDASYFPFVYFNYNSATIRKDDFGKLKQLIALLEDNPDVNVKIESHTDSRGSSAYNEILSQKRADATYNYLIANGLAPERIASYIGYGESQLANHCNDTAKCTEQEHQENRRTHFIIIKLQED